MILLFWFFFAMLFYSIIGYPMMLLAIAPFFPKRIPTPPSAPIRISFLIAAHNEESIIREKIENTLSLRNSGNHHIQIVVVSDGSTDQTVPLLKTFEDPRITVLETDGHVGKLAALNWALEFCDGDVVIFSDANGLLAEGALDALISHFGDPEVGGVCGKIIVPKAKRKPLGKAESRFWSYDQTMKLAETRIAGAVSAQGSIYAIRSDQVGPIDEGCADDFVMSVRPVHAGLRLVFEPKATTEEAVSENILRETNRRIRSTEMGFRGLMQNRALMNPFKHGLYAWQLISHKLIRRLNPLFLICLFFSNMVLAGSHWFFTMLALCQVAFYGLGILGVVSSDARKLPGVGMVTFFITTNAAMLLGIIAYLRGRKSSKWVPFRETSGSD